jgi:hypothetical protein
MEALAAPRSDPMGGFFSAQLQSCAGGRGFFGFLATVAAAGSVTFEITNGFNSDGPFNGIPNNTYNPGFGERVSGLTPSGHSAGSITPDPIHVNGALLIVFGDVDDTGPPGPPAQYITVCLFGTWPQSHFSAVNFTDGAGNVYDLNTATALFNSPWAAQPGYTIWSWPVIANNPNFANPITVSW